MGDDGSLDLRLARDCLAAMAHHAERVFPEECCGLMLGRGRQVTRVVAIDNRLGGHQATDGFLIAPADLLAADEAARAAGLDCIGVYHSHPRHPARPSARDLAGAVASWSYLIIGCATGTASEVRSWRLRDDGSGFVEQPLYVGGRDGYEPVGSWKQEQNGHAH